MIFLEIAGLTLLAFLPFALLFWAFDRGLNAIYNKDRYEDGRSEEQSEFTEIAELVEGDEGDH